MGNAGPEMVKMLRDYAIEEPSYTCAFAAWELNVHPSSIINANRELLKLEIVEEIEPRCGPYAAVYQYKPIPKRPNNVRRLHLPELDESRVIGIGAAAPRRGVAVAHTGGPIGPSGKPGLDRKRGRAGKTVKRARQGT